MVEAQEKKKSHSTIENQKSRYDFKIILRILFFIGARENQVLETYGAIVKKGLGLGEEVYKYLEILERDGIITRLHNNGKKKPIKITNHGEETIQLCFSRAFSSYKPVKKIKNAQNLTIEDLAKRSLLEKFVQYLSSETISFLEQKKSGQSYILDRYLSSLNEDLLGFFKRKLDEFCRRTTALKPEVN